MHAPKNGSFHRNLADSEPETDRNLTSVKFGGDWMPRVVKIRWVCDTCGAEIITRPRTVPYADEPNRGICPLCGSETLVKREEIFEVL